MLSATAIKDLKEGNAIEEDLAKLLKGGLNTIADNMLQECRKRSAALEDLEENLEEEAARPKASKRVEDKAYLGHVLSATIKHYKKAADESYERYEDACDALTEYWRRERIWEKEYDQEEKRGERLQNLLSLSRKLDAGFFADTIKHINNEELRDHKLRMTELRAKGSMMKEELEKIKEMPDHYWGVYQEKSSDWAEREEAFHLVADMAGLKLDT